ncbi:GNAT family N-acetyltransferase [Amycolatopsis magusensis]|uniref:GNAT family N-acetyltransferase n=1 Tax=Amycolatopsis magusensis TaxID=882444 RepID=UPI0024A8563E|nr:GNAT family N-acetyltransferase [Amycolatopsis magusensis]MDI5980140.1 GNAT family N-acetyltransferase [Amycolatopsis magusensis]
MEPVEINAGAYYLRQLRADDRLDDRPTLVEAFEDPVHRRFVPNYRLQTLEAAGEYVARRSREWAEGTRCSWAIAEPTTGDLLGEVGLKRVDLEAGTAEAAIWVHPRGRGQGIGTLAVGAALRFGFGALDLKSVEYRHAETNKASEKIAQRCGFTLIGEAVVPTAGEKDLVWTKEAE